MTETHTCDKCGMTGIDLSGHTCRVKNEAPVGYALNHLRASLVKHSEEGPRLVELLNDTISKVLLERDEAKADAERAKAERNKLEKEYTELHKLKTALVECAKHVGASVSPSCSIEFLCHVPEEVRLVVEEKTKKFAWAASHADAANAELTKERAESTKLLDEAKRLAVDTGKERDALRARVAGLEEKERLLAERTCQAQVLKEHNDALRVRVAELETLTVDAQAIKAQRFVVGHIIMSRFGNSAHVAPKKQVAPPKQIVVDALVGGYPTVYRVTSVSASKSWIVVDTGHGITMVQETP